MQQWANPLPSDVSVPESESAVEAVTVIRRTKMKLASQGEHILCFDESFVVVNKSFWF